MNRSTVLALLLFCSNTAVGAALMWVNRPRTVATMSASDLDPVERRRLLDVLDDAGVMPAMVRVCTVAPCTDGPAAFVSGGRVRRVVLPHVDVPGPIVEVIR